MCVWEGCNLTVLFLSLMSHQCTQCVSAFSKLEYINTSVYQVILPSSSGGGVEWSGGGFTLYNICSCVCDDRIELHPRLWACESTEDECSHHIYCRPLSTSDAHFHINYHLFWCVLPLIELTYTSAFVLQLFSGCLSTASNTFSPLNLYQILWDLFAHLSGWWKLWLLCEKGRK